MDYYKRKKLMFKLVDTIVKRCGKIGIEENHLIYEAETTTACGERTIKNYVEKSVEVGKYKRESGCLIWNTTV